MDTVTSLSTIVTAEMMSGVLDQIVGLLPVVKSARRQETELSRCMQFVQ